MSANHLTHAFILGDDDGWVNEWKSKLWGNVHFRHCFVRLTRPVYRSETNFYHQLMCQTQNKHLRRAGTCVWQRIQSAETRAGVGFLFLNLILNEARRLKQKNSEQAAETELMNGFFVNGSIFENACWARLTFSARLGKDEFQWGEWKGERDVCVWSSIIRNQRCFEGDLI